MNKDKLKMLEEYIKLGMSPILLENISTDNIKNAVILSADCDNTLLNGHYEGREFMPPQWYTDLMEKNKQNRASSDLFFCYLHRQILPVGAALPSLRH